MALNLVSPLAPLRCTGTRQHELAKTAHRPVHHAQAQLDAQHAYRLQSCQPLMQSATRSAAQPSNIVTTTPAMLHALLAHLSISLESNVKHAMPYA